MRSNSALALVREPSTSPDLTLSVDELNKAFALVSHATRAGFDVGSTFDLTWSPPTSGADVAAWSVTTTDGHRLTRFTSDRIGWFREPHTHAVALPGWVFDWIKRTSSNADVRIRIDADGPIIVLPGHGTFRPEARKHSGVDHLLGGLHTRSKNDASHVRLHTEVRALFREIDGEKRDHVGDSVFMGPLDDAGWTASWVDRPGRVGLDPSYLVDALKSLVRVAKEFDGPSIDARWAGRKDAVLFTAPHLLCVIMPRG